LSDSQITSNLDRVGINLGSSDVIVKASAVAIKNQEVDKMVVAAKNKKSNLNSKKLQDESEDERDARLDAVLSHVGGDLNENLQDQKYDHIIDLSPVDRKKMLSAAKNLKIGKIPKKPKTPSKIVIK